MRAGRRDFRAEVREAEQYMSERRQRTAPMRETGAVEYRMRLLFRGDVQQDRRFVVSADVEGAAKPTVHVFRHRNVPAVEVGVLIPNGINDRSRFVVLAHGGSHI